MGNTASRCNHSFSYAQYSLKHIRTPAPEDILNPECYWSFVQHEGGVNNVLCSSISAFVFQTQFLLEVIGAPAAELVG